VAVRKGRKRSMNVKKEKIARRRRSSCGRLEHQWGERSKEPIGRKSIVAVRTGKRKRKRGTSHLGIKSEKSWTAYPHEGVRGKLPGVAGPRDNTSERKEGGRKTSNEGKSSKAALWVPNH